MKKNPLRRIWLDGGFVINGWLHIPNTWSAEVMANAGWDSIVVDLQHGLHSMESAIQLLQVISTTDTVPLARVNWNTPGEIMRLLDAAQGAGADPPLRAGLCGLLCGRRRQWRPVVHQHLHGSDGGGIFQQRLGFVATRPISYDGRHS